MYCAEYLTVNSEVKVTIPFSSISHVIESKNEQERGTTCWVQFHSGKSIHIAASYREVSEDLDNYYNISR